MNDLPSHTGPFSHLLSRNYTVVREKQHKLLHTVYDGSPDDWAKEKGATHTLFTGEGPGRGTRPAKLLKTVLFVGVDEDPEGGIVWQKWDIKLHSKWAAQ